MPNTIRPPNPLLDNFASNQEVRRALDEFYRRRGADKLRRQRDARNVEANGWRRRVSMTLFGMFFCTAILMADGLRREAEEFTGARLLELSLPLRVPVPAGGGSLLLSKAGALLPIGQSARVGGGAEPTSEKTITQASQEFASLLFPGGDAMRLERQSVFTLRQLDYARGGVRRRLVSLTRGACFLQCGDGENDAGQSAKGNNTTTAESGATVSRCVVALPGLLRVVARDAALRVSLDEASGTARIEVARGTAQVILASGGASRIVQGGKTYRFRNKPKADDAAAAEAEDDELEAELLPQARLGLLKKIGNRLRAHQDRGGSFLAAMERDLLKMCYPLLQKAGLPPGGYGFQATDATRRLATQNALRRLQTAFAALPDDSANGAVSALPERITLSTLAELPLDDRSRTEILDACDGATLRSYRCEAKNGSGGGYRIVAAARDSGQTLYELTEAGVRPLDTKRRG